MPPANSSCPGFVKAEEYKKINKICMYSQGVPSLVGKTDRETRNWNTIISVMEICARASVGTKKGGILLVGMDSWHQERVKKSCAQARRSAVARWAIQSNWQECKAKAWDDGTAEGELGWVGRSQGLQTLIEYLACAWCSENPTKHYNLCYNVCSEELTLITADRARHRKKKQ